MHVHFGIVMDHLDRMTDPTGLIQHAIYNVPRRESGYTTDDNARALRLCTRLWCRHPEARMLNRVTNYLSFLEYARTAGGGFHNFLSYDRKWLDAEGCGDCQGQAVRSLAEVLGSSLPEDFRDLARELIESVLPTLADLRSLRAQAYVVLAWGHLRSAGVKDIDPLENVAWLAARRLVECYERSQRPDWPWFESRLTYANAVLPHALFLVGRRWPTEPFLAIAEASFAFLDRATTSESTTSESTTSESTTSEATTGESTASESTTGECTTAEAIFWPIGNDGWHCHGEDKALYDQQPVEAITMADAALAAFQLLGDTQYLATFRRAREWFHGDNSLRQPLGDLVTGACCDGLQADALNRNQGAESTLAFLGVELLNEEARQLSGEQDTTATANA